MGKEWELSERLMITGVRTVVVGAGWRNYVFVLLDTDGGITGLGEASIGGQTHSVLGAIKDLEPLLIGSDPFRIEHIWQQAYRHAFWRGGPTFLSALSGIEVALWDIKGQALGVPIYRLLGGKVRDRVRAYANGPRGDTPDRLAASARDLVQRGYSALKWVPFGATPILGGRRYIDAAVAEVRAVREAVGPDVELMVDGHGRLGPAIAMRMAEALAPFNLLFFEEPCLPENVPAMLRIAARSPIPIATGERRYTRWDFRELLETRGIGVLQPDIVQSGGLFEARKIAALAEMHFVSVAPHNPWSWVNTTASLHLDAVIPNFLIQEVITEPEPWRDEIVSERPRLGADGCFQVPESPGLGISLDLEAVKRFPPVEGRPPAAWHDDGSVADW
jgi:galactonate dehydratase